MSENRRQRIRLSLEAEGRSGLFPLLEEARNGVIAGRFRLDELLAVGRQSYVFAAIDLEQNTAVIVKQCAFDYRNPLLYNRASTMRSRQALGNEYQVLQACTTGHLPQPVALVTSSSPVPAAVESPVLSRELFVVEERIAAPTLTETALELWPALPPAQREAVAAGIALDFARFWEAMRDQGWHYGDISADNFLVEGRDRLRVVDAGSAFPADAATAPAGYTPAFTTPNIFCALREGRALTNDLSAVLPMLAKVLHFALTRLEPLNGMLPEMSDPVLDEYSPSCRQALARMLLLDEQPGRLVQARESLARWAEQVAEPS